MKSFNTLELCIENNKNNDFIFKQTALNKMYSYSDLDTIKKFQKKHKCNLYEYVNYNKPIRLFFYIKLTNNINIFLDILNTILKTLKLNKNDIIIIQENDYIYRIVHKYYYFENFTLLDEYIFKKNLHNIFLDKKQFLPALVNNDVVINEKYDLNDSILNNTISLLKYNINININSKIYTQKYINNIDFSNYNTLFIKSGMGSGKSTTTVNYIKNNNISSFLILSCRKTLTYTIYDKLKENNIDVYNYITTTKENIKLVDKLIISPDSILKLDFPLKKFDFIWIDEGVSFMYYIGNYLCIDTNTKSIILDILEWLLINCNKLLITDADLNNNTIYYYLYYRKQLYSQLLIYNNFSNNIKYNLYKNENIILEKLKTDYLTKQNIYICCDTLSKTKFIYNYLINIDASIKVLIYNSESTEKINKLMYDVNTFWSNYNVVIVSPKVVFGVDFNIKHFDCVYGFYKCTTLNVRETFQQLHRIRNIKKQLINILVYDNINLELDNILTKIKYNIENSINNNLFYKKTKYTCDTILNCINYTIDANGYKYINMNIPLNYLIIYCIYEKNKSLNDFYILLEQHINLITNI